MKKVVDIMIRGIDYMIKHILKYIIIFLSMVVLLAGMLVLCAKIPSSAIRGNVKESGQFLCQKPLFEKKLNQVEGSKIDHYADAILLNIAYGYDRNHPLRSIMKAEYYHSDLHNENENLLKAATDDLSGNQQYLRYWHGSNVIVKPLLVVWNLKEILICNGVVLAGLGILLIVLLVERKRWFLVAGMISGLTMISVWFVPFSLEYTWNFLLMFVCSIIAVILSANKRFHQTGILFLISGIVTNYFDFLTTETITLTVPLLLMLSIKNSSSETETVNSFSLVGKSIFAWSFGYFGMWIMKWLLSAVILSQNVIPDVLQHAKERSGGENGSKFFGYAGAAIWKNIKCLFPFEYGMAGILTGITLVLILIYIAYVYHGKQIHWNSIVLYALIGCIPFIRFALLTNHSYVHCFFTYRAQIGTVLAVFLILEELTGDVWRQIRK